MTLIDEGNGKDLEFGHTDYMTGEGRFITKSENLRERYVNPELRVKERKRIGNRDKLRRNKYDFSLFCENNTQIKGTVIYNPANENLFFSYYISAQHGKRVGRLN